MNKREKYRVDVWEKDEDEATHSYIKESKRKRDEAGEWLIDQALREYPDANFVRVTLEGGDLVHEYMEV